MLKLVIIEDEPATARHLYATLQGMDSFELLVILNSVKKALDWLQHNPNAYDLVFMDIRLSDGLSFEICEQVTIEAPVIFVTAYDEYAMKAFKTNGIDYVLKPFDKQELHRALNKFKTLNRNHPHFIPVDLIKISEQLKASTPGYKQSFLVHYRDKLIPVQTKDIAWFYTVNEVCHATTFDKRKFLISFTLEQLQQQLNPAEFFRANRQFIVQRSAIQEVAFYFNGRLILSLVPTPDENILISKARVPEFKDWMNQ